MISDGFEWSWFPVKPFWNTWNIYENYQDHFMYHTISSKGKACWNRERAKNKLVVGGTQDLEAQVELLFYAIETNILFGWIDIDVC